MHKVIELCNETLTTHLNTHTYQESMVEVTWVSPCCCTVCFGGLQPSCNVSNRQSTIDNRSSVYSSPCLLQRTHSFSSRESRVNNHLDQSMSLPSMRPARPLQSNLLFCFVLFCSFSFLFQKTNVNQAWNQSPSTRVKNIFNLTWNYCEFHWALSHFIKRKVLPPLGF